MSYAPTSYCTVALEKKKKKVKLLMVDFIKIFELSLRLLYDALYDAWQEVATPYKSV